MQKRDIEKIKPVSGEGETVKLLFDPAELKFDDKGLIPAIVIDRKTKRLLTLAYMNRESLAISLKKGLTCFFSRSRQELWLKGETSGNYQKIVSITADCDKDALEVIVDPAGPACHLGNFSCFENPLLKKNCREEVPADSEKPGKASAAEYTERKAGEAEAGAEEGKKTAQENLKPQEYWDIYDRNKQLTGRRMKRNDWCLKDDEYHLSVLAVLARPDGKTLITRRAMDKHWAPGWWEVTGGACMAGESSFEAICREVREEVGLDVSKANGGLALEYHRENPGEGDNYFVDVYRFVLDFDEKDIKLQDEEATGFQIVTPEELRKIGEQGIFLHFDSIHDVLFP